MPAVCGSAFGVARCEVKLTIWLLFFIGCAKWNRSGARRGLSLDKNVFSLILKMLNKYYCRLEIVTK